MIHISVGQGVFLVVIQQIPQVFMEDFHTLGKPGRAGGIDAVGGVVLLQRGKGWRVIGHSGSVKIIQRHRLHGAVEQGPLFRIQPFGGQQRFDPRVGEDKADPFIRVIRLQADESRAGKHDPLANGIYVLRPVHIQAHAVSPPDAPRFQGVGDFARPTA